MQSVTLDKESRSNFVQKFFLFSFLSCFGPINGLYAVLMLGVDLKPWQLGIGFGVASLFGVLLEVPAGTIADRFSYRTALILSQGIRLLAYLVLLACPTFEGFLGTMILLSAKDTLISGTTEAFLFEGLKLEDRECSLTSTLARLTVVNRAALILATLVGAGLISYGLQTLLFATIAPCILTICAAIMLPKLPVRASAQQQSTYTMIRLGLRQIFRRPVVAWYVLLLGTALGVDLWSYWSVLGREVGLPAFGQALVMTGVNTAGLLAGMVAGSSKNLSTHSVLLGLVVAGVALLLAALTLSRVSLMLAFIFLVTHYTASILVQANLIPFVSTSVRATVLSVPAFIASLIAVVTNLFFGLIAHMLGFQASFILAASFFLFLVITFILTFKIYGIQDKEVSC